MQYLHWSQQKMSCPVLALAQTTGNLWKSPTQRCMIPPVPIAPAEKHRENRLLFFPALGLDVLWGERNAHVWPLSVPISCRRRTVSEETRLNKRKSVISYRSSFARDLISVSTVRPSPRDMAKGMQLSGVSARACVCVYLCACVCVCCISVLSESQPDRLQLHRSRGEVHDGGSPLSGARIYLSLEQRWQTQILLRPHQNFCEP